MRIWAFPSFYPYDSPGQKWTGIFAHRQYKGLIANGAELQVIMPVKWAPPYPFYLLDKDWKAIKAIGYPEERVYDGIQVHHTRIQNLRPSRFFKPYHERYVDSIVSFFKRRNIRLDPKVDIFYAQWLPIAAYVQEAAHKLGLKSAVLVIGDDVIIEPHKSKYALDTFVNTWANADIRLSVADYLAVEANKIAGKQYKYEVVRRGVNHDIFIPLDKAGKEAARRQFDIPENKLVILSIGTAIVRKGWLDLLDALQNIKPSNPDFVLVAAHAGHPDFDLLVEVQKRDLTANFINLGEVDPNEVCKLLNTADIFCLPSHWEGIANAVVEAMSCGLPVITTNVCGHPELVTDGDNGILVPPKSPNILTEKLQLLMNQPELRDELGRNARAFIVNTWGDYAFNSRKLYNVLQGNII